jgi:hypothetical protein
MTKFDLHSLARLGAAARIKELNAEIASIRKAFPDSASKREKILIHHPPQQRRRKMSAEARKKISEAQKKRWAAQKSGDKKK